MTTVTPIDLGFAVAQSIPVPPQPQPLLEEVDPVARVLQVSAEQYRQLEERARLNQEYQRYEEFLQRRNRQDYVRAQQHLRPLRPNYVDPRLIQQQIQWLSASL